MSTSSQAIGGAMDSQVMAQEVAARNIANIVTPGFKRNIALVESMEKGQSGQGSGAPTMTGVGLDLSQGPLQATGNELDFAIQGDGFFAVKTPNGVAYTRNGTFRLNENRVLVTQDGYPVLGDSGELQAPESAEKITASSEGELHAGSTSLGKLKVVAFDKPALLQQAGNSMYLGDAAGPKNAAASTVHQGSLEASNVEPVTEMVRMMATFRDYQACARSLRSIEESATKLYAWARS